MRKPSRRAHQVVSRAECAWKAVMTKQGRYSRLREAEHLIFCHEQEVRGSSKEEKHMKRNRNKRISSAQFQRWSLERRETLSSIFFFWANVLIRTEELHKKIKVQSKEKVTQHVAHTHFQNTEREFSDLFHILLFENLRRENKMRVYESISMIKTLVELIGCFTSINHIKESI